MTSLLDGARKLVTRGTDLGERIDGLEAVVAAGRGRLDDALLDDGGEHAARLLSAGEVVWGRSRDHQRSATIADLFVEAGLDHDPDLLAAFQEFWEPHTATDPEVRPLLEALRADQDFLLAGGVFTPELIETWIEYKIENEIKPIAARPHPFEYELYFGV